MKKALALIACLLSAVCATAVSKPHVVALGKWTTIKWMPDDESKPLDLRIRALYVDGKTKEFTIGGAHEVTDRTFVIQRMFRLNDSSPGEAGNPRWRWQKGGWLLVDRTSGRVQQLNAPEFDPDRSDLSWFRDYAAYCGISDDGQKTFVMVIQLGRRRPLLKKLAAEGSVETCAAPAWRRNPVRVTFETKQDPKLTFAVSSRTVDPILVDPILEDEEERE